MKKIIFILILISLYGCGLQRRTYCERKANKVARILKDCPQLIDTITVHDTTIIRDTFTVTIPAKIDRNGIDSLLKEYCDALLVPIPIGTVDTVTIRIKEKIYLQCSPEKVIGTGEKLLINGKDTVVISYKGTKTGLDLSIISVKRQIQITKTLVVPCPDRNKIGIKDLIFDWWIMLLIIFVAGLVAGLYRK